MKDDRIQQIVKELKARVFERCNLNSMDDEQLEEAIEELMVEYFRSEYITIEERVDVAERVFGSIRGLGILDSILKDDSITEVMINGPDHIFIEKSGQLSRLEQTFESERQLEDIIQTALTEAQIESLIIAKGYTDCVAYMTNEGISVAVSAPEGGLQQADVAVIADIVMSQSDYLLTDIRIVEVN